MNCDHLVQYHTGAVIDKACNWFVGLVRISYIIINKLWGIQKGQSKNGQSRETGNIGCTRHRPKTGTTKTTPLYASKHK